MKQSVIICMLLFLTGCVQTELNDSSHISEEELVVALRNHNIDIKEGTFLEEDIFVSKLNGVKPKGYELNEKLIVIYEYDTPEEREKGEKEFATKTTYMNLVSFKTFIKRNILIFYVHGEDLNLSQVPFEKEIQSALDSPMEG